MKFSPTIPRYGAYIQQAVRRVAKLVLDLDRLLEHNPDGYLKYIHGADGHHFQHISSSGKFLLLYSQAHVPQLTSNLAA